MNKNAEYGYSIGTAWQAKPPVYADHLGSDFVGGKMTRLLGDWAPGGYGYEDYDNDVDLVPEGAVELVDGMF
jgi:hypothetical protein